MGEERQIDPGHDVVRRTLRIVCPAVALVGLGFLAVGLMSFFSAFGSFERPRYFWCAFVGMPLLAIGLILTKFVYLGSIIRYMMGEMAPPAKDTFNYMARETTPGVRDLSRAASQGIAEGFGVHESGDASATCPKCGAANAVTSNFCGHCGSALARPYEGGSPEL